MRLFAPASAAGATLLAAVTLVACSAPQASGPVSPGTSTRLPPVEHAHEVALAGYASQSEAHGDGTVKAAPPFVTPERLARGYTIVAVGVNGDNLLSAGLGPGLIEGGYPGAVEVVDWTTGHWPLFLYHLRSDKRHQAGGRLIARKIAAYQDQYPGREVNLVGYSAGAVVAVEAIEALPAGRSVDRVVLLAGAISPVHDLRPILERTRLGIWNYYQPQDVVALWAGTLVAGTADGQHIVSAGAVGFWPPPGATDADKQLYRDKLAQQPYVPQMAKSLNLGGHFQCIGRKFVADWIAPVLDGQPVPSVAGANPTRVR